METKTSFWLIVLLLSGFLFQSCPVLKTGQKRDFITINNPSAIERADELIVLDRSAIEEKLGRFSPGERLAISSEEGKIIAVQLDDLDGNGSWEDAVFLYSFEPRQKVKFRMAKTTRSTNDITRRANTRMQEKDATNNFSDDLKKATMHAATPTDFSRQRLPFYLTEGPAWENDKIAFRLYFDTRNTKDIFGKRTAKMIMDSVGRDTTQNYHKMSDWGMDVLAVGKSLGAGSLAISFNDSGRDTLVRLGGKNIEETSYEALADGPVRAVFRMTYKNWKIADGVAPLTVHETISIWGGKYYYESSVSVENAPANSMLVTGIVNLYDSKAVEMVADSCRIMYSYGNQSEHKDKLGLALIIPAKYYPSFGKTANKGSDVLNTYTAAMPLKQETLKFRFAAGWESSDLLFTREESFKTYLNFEGIKLSQPMVITVGN